MAMKTTTQRKSVKMEADELTEKIKACVKEALDEQAEAKAEGDPEGGDPAVEAAPASAWKANALSTELLPQFQRL